MMELSTIRGLPSAAKNLGFAGLIPQAIALLMALDNTWKFAGLASGYFYAALIFSFLGGLWWGIAISRSDAPQWIFGAAVVPSLLAFASGIPWMIGTGWPGPSLFLLAALMILSLFVDHRLKQLGLISEALFAMRVRLSLGLGALTFALGLLA
jgi:hypothetical protein